MSAGCVLAVFAHPDDESLLAGGTLASWAAAGASVVLVSATRGELGASSSRGPAPEVLGTVREQELRAAGRVLGAVAVECLGLPDGELAGIERSAVEGRLVATLRRWRPRVVLTFGPEGLYWHPDHVAVHELVCAALDIVADEGLLPRLEYATWPEGWMSALVAALRSRKLPTDFFGLSPQAFGAPAATITTVRDIRPFLAAKLRALRSHRSQLGACPLLQGIPEDIAEEFLGREFFVAARPGRSEEPFLGRAAPDVGAARRGGECANGRDAKTTVDSPRNGGPNALRRRRLAGSALPGSASPAGLRRVLRRGHGRLAVRRREGHDHR
jgi:LmbE family N-acetylglucosaminyl deacetylase